MYVQTNEGSFQIQLSGTGQQNIYYGVKHILF